MFENLSNDQILKLKTDFQSLTTVEQKFEFWIKKLNKPYIFSWHVELPLISDFIIISKSKSDNKLINEMSLSEVQIYGRAWGIKLVRINDEIEAIDSILLTAKNKYSVLEKEINRVIKIVNDKEIGSTDIFKRTANEFWIHGYEQSYIKHQELDLTESVFEVANLVCLVNGYNTGEFLKYLEVTKVKVKSYPDSFTRERTTIKQQILIMDSLGMLDILREKLSTESPKGIYLEKDLIKLLSPILNVGEQSIKEVLTYLNKTSPTFGIRTIKNYDFVINLYNEIGLNSYADMIKKQQDKLKTKQSIP